MLKSTVRIGLLLVLAVGLASRTSAEPATEKPAPKEGKEAPAPKTPPMSKEEVAKILAKATREVEKVRGASFKKKVPMLWIDEKGAVAYIRKFAKRKYAKDELRNLSTVMRHLSLLPSGVNLDDFMEQMGTSGVAGLYDPMDKKFMVLKKVNKMGRPVVYSIFVHELAHALQDEQTDLLKFVTAKNLNFDAAEARRCVVEGEATLIMLQSQYLAAKKDVLKSDDDIATSVMEMGKLAQALQGGMDESMLFAYASGAGFARECVRKNGWNSLAALFKNPPLSTEQVICPKKFLDPKTRDYPVRIELPDLAKTLGQGFAYADTVTVGQYYLSLILREKIVQADLRAELASAGWDGDSLAVYPKKGAKYSAAVWFTRWDRPVDAEQFVEAYRVAAPNRFDPPPRKAEKPAADPDKKEAAKKKAPKSKLRWDKPKKTGKGVLQTARTQHGLLVIERRGVEVVVLENVPEKMVGGLLARAWNAKRIFAAADKAKGAQDARTTAPYEKAFIAKWNRKNNPEGVLKGARYTDKKNGFELLLPKKGWSIAKKRPMALVKLLVKSEERDGTTFSISMAPGGPIKDFEEMVDLNRKQAKMMGIKKFDRDETIETAQGKAHVLVYTFRTIKIYQQLYFKNGNQVVLSLTVIPAKDIDDVMKEMADTLKSFRFLEKKKEEEKAEKK